MKNLFYMLSIMLICTSCNKKSFTAEKTGANGDGQAETVPEQTPGAIGGIEPDRDLSDILVDEDTGSALDESDVEALERCLEHWAASLPFNLDQSLPVKKLKAQVIVFGIGTSVDDREVSAKDKLIIIDAGVAIGSKPVYKLCNSRGWYCLKTQVNVGSNLTIHTTPTTRVIDSKVNVNLGGSGGVGGIGVNVGSDVTLDPNGC